MFTLNVHYSNGNNLDSVVDINIPKPELSLRELKSLITDSLGLSNYDIKSPEIIKTMFDYAFARYDDEEESFFDFDDESGKELTLFDYNIKSGDSLRLIAVPISGGGIISEFKISDLSLKYLDVLNAVMLLNGFKYIGTGRNYKEYIYSHPQISFPVSAFLSGPQIREVGFNTLKNASIIDVFNISDDNTSIPIKFDILGYPFFEFKVSLRYRIIEWLQAALEKLK